MSIVILPACLLKASLFFVVKEALVPGCLKKEEALELGAYKKGEGSYKREIVELFTKIGCFSQRKFCRVKRVTFSCFLDL